MFRASSCPASGATTAAVAASGLPSELGDSTAVGRGRAGQLMQLKTHYSILYRIMVMKHFVIYFFLFFFTFVGRCIVIYLYSKTNQTHNISNSFYFGTTLYMFRTVFPSNIRSQTTYCIVPYRFCGCMHGKTVRNM